MDNKIKNYTSKVPVNRTISQVAMIEDYCCFECDKKSKVKILKRRYWLYRIWQNKYVECPHCKTINDIWFTTPPLRHFIYSFLLH